MSEVIGMKNDWAQA